MQRDPLDIVFSPFRAIRDYSLSCVFGSVCGFSFAMAIQKDIASSAEIGKFIPIATAITGIGSLALISTWPFIAGNGKWSKASAAILALSFLAIAGLTHNALQKMDQDPKTGAACITIIPVVDAKICFK